MNSSSSNFRFRLAPPIEESWNTKFTDEQIDLQPVLLDDLIVVSSDSKLTALSLAHGERLWSISLAGRATNLCASPFGFGVSHNEDESSVVTMFDRSGKKMWEYRHNWGLGHASLRACDDILLGLGSSLSYDGRAVCQVIRSMNGEVETVFDCPGDLPDVAPGGFVYSVRSSDPSQSGLFFVSGKRVERIVVDSHWIRTVSGKLAFIDTYDRGGIESKLCAIDLNSRKLIWTSPGGPTFRIAADGKHVAAVETTSEHGFSLVLRDVANGSEVWRTESIEGRSAACLLAEDVIVLYVDSRRLEVFDRTHGKSIQLIRRSSRFAGGGVLTRSGLIDSLAGNVWCLRGREQ